MLPTIDAEGESRAMLLDLGTRSSPPLPPINARATTLDDPSTSSPRQYLLTSSDLLEIHRMERPRGACLMGSRLARDGDLLACTRIDPLYFLLPRGRDRWEPAGQILGRLPEAVRGVLKEAQMGHLHDREEMFGEEMFRFSRERALVWLGKKHARATGAIRREAMATMGGREKADLEGHIIPEGEEEGGEDGLEEERARRSGLQVIGNYLTEEWFESLRGSLGIVEEKEKEGGGSCAIVDVERAKMVQYTMGVDGVDDESSPTCLKKAIPLQSAGLKRLSKVDKKGMKSLTSFFQVKKKPKAST